MSLPQRLAAVRFQTTSLLSHRTLLVELEPSSATLHRKRLPYNSQQCELGSLTFSTCRSSHLRSGSLSTFCRIPVTPEPRSIVSVTGSSPSLVRRSRPVGQGRTFRIFRRCLSRSRTTSRPSLRESNRSVKGTSKSLNRMIHKQMHNFHPRRRNKRSNRHTRKRMQEVETHVAALRSAALGSG